MSEAISLQPNSAYWTEALFVELLNASQNGRVGHQLVSETDDCRVWHLDVAPGDRLPFHCHVLDYFWTALSAGKSRSRFSNGEVRETAYEPGTTRHYKFDLGESMIHDLENVGDTPLRFVTVEFKNGKNPALKI